MRIENIVGQLPVHPTARYKTRSTINTAVIHHSATPVTTTPWAIANYHVAIRGYPQIAYHYLAYNNGRVYQVNEDTTLSWHAGDGTNHPNNENNKAVGIALVGDFTKAPPPEAQLVATRELLAHLQDKYGPLRVIGHREGWYRGKYGVPTACPGDAFTNEMVRALAPTSGDTKIREAVWAQFAHWPEAIRQVARQRGFGAPLGQPTTIMGETIYPFALGLLVANGDVVIRDLVW